MFVVEGQWVKGQWDNGQWVKGQWDGQAGCGLDILLEVDGLKRKEEKKGENGKMNTRSDCF